MPITALVFGGRRREVAPLVYEARNWQHGVLVGASVASETTAAAVGQVGVTRRDPMAMQPFCGYNFADYWQHWLNVGAKLARPPRIYHVNWFRRDAQGKFLWPGLRRESARARLDARSLCRQEPAPRRRPSAACRDRRTSTPTGSTSRPKRSLRCSRSMRRLWRKEVAEIREYLGQVSAARLPAALVGRARRYRAAARLERARRAQPLQPSSQLKRMVCGEPCSGRRPRPIIPWPLICRLSRRTKDSSPSSALHERAVGALVDEHELVAVDLDARVQARDQACP